MRNNGGDSSRTVWKVASRRPWLGSGFVVAFLAVALLTQGPYQLSQWTSWAFFGILALSFTLVWGHAGIFSFGQAAFFGLGAYSYGVASLNLLPVTQETLSALALSVVVPSMAAAALGYFMFYGRVGDIYVAIITLAVTLGLQTLMSTDQTSQLEIGVARLGGFNGLSGLPPIIVPQIGSSPRALSGAEFFVGAALLALAMALLARWILKKPFGRVSIGIRVNELRSELLGYDVRRYRVAMFTLCGAIAGIAGGAFAAWGSFISPAIFGLQQAALVAIWVLVGGRRSILGAFAGVVIVELIGSSTGAPAELTLVILGLLLILVVLFLPDGVVPALGRALTRAVDRFRSGVGRTSLQASDDEAIDTDFVKTSLSPQSLVAKGIRRTFGGLVAVDRVDLAVEPGMLHCVIGPNGAGKSTFFHALIGRHLPDRGIVTLGDEDVTRMRPDERARMGLGIKLQVPAVYWDLTVHENLWLAAYGYAKKQRAATMRANLALTWLHLDDKGGSDASALSHGEVQHLEIGMVLARGPSVILLDEPTAGMTAAETRETSALLASLLPHVTIIVVEHDMDFVRQLDSPVTVLHQGAVFARGTIEELQQDEAVLDIYLGRGDAHASP